MTLETDALVREWREAAKGVTPGEWREEICDGRCFVWGLRGQLLVVDCGEVTNGHSASNAAWLARCSPTGIGALLDALTAIKAERNNLQARLTARAKTMLHLRDALAQVHDHIEDEGDRVYFGSTNDADTLKEVWHDLDGWAWDDIMSDGKLPDVYEASRKAHAEASALREQLERAREALGPFARAAERISTAHLDGHAGDDDELPVKVGHLRAARRIAQEG